MEPLTIYYGGQGDLKLAAYRAILDSENINYSLVNDTKLIMVTTKGRLNPNACSMVVTGDGDLITSVRALVAWIDQKALWQC